MSNHRNQFRIPVQRRGFVTRDKQTTLCEVLDLTETGLLFSTELSLALDETVRIECQLDGECFLHCEVLVTHVQAPRFGGRITELSPEHQAQLAKFMERLIRASMEGF
jgi:hypothetical protein